MLLIIIISFLTTGFIYFQHFQRENEVYHEERLKRKEIAINEAISYFLQDQPASRNTDSIVSLFDEKICEWADINKLDINIYNLNGNLLISSNPDLYDKGIVPENLPISILRALQAGTGQLLVDRRADTLRYMVTYDYIRNFENKPIAIINLPYFDNDNLKLEEQSNFLIQLTQIYLALFAIAGIVAYLLSNYIAGSLKAIGEKLKETRINDFAPLDWRFNDEIGSLVSQYNKMLGKLKESADTLAKTERESAWKEMAKQVAHEIKNPLTPMRLNVQFLEKTLKTDDPQKLKEFTQSMISQIDTLTAIAGAFSSFANMPELKIEKFSLDEIIQRTTDLYPGYDLTFDCEDKQITLELDKDQLIRVMNNLINNAIQAVPDDREPKIKVMLSKREKDVLIAIQDNGCGIPEEQREKIFEPKFTTKTKGMGLGLAMVKSILNGFNADIWLESELNVGTTFFISIPV
jgi:signal transduction histidine kinase